VLRWLSRSTARRYAHELQTYDTLVGTAGLQAGGQWLIERFTGGLEVTGAAHVPTSGPLLIVVNHPGYADAAALFAAIPRDDLRIVAAGRDMLQALPNTTRYLYQIDTTAASRLGVVRQVTRHLRSGGAVLTFPGGQIEPDPAVLPGAGAALDDWSNSLDTFARLTAPLTIVPAVVSGVLAPAALRHPLTRLRQNEQDRRWLAATLQVIRPLLRTMQVRLQFGTPLVVVAPSASGQTATISSSALHAMRDLIAQAEARA
jgi:1-acyl-sn-glycerol-3-phosphate acyltransferase